MEELRLPWNNREGLLYEGAISLITCLIMSTFNIARVEGRFDLDIVITSLTCIPILWVVVMILMTFIVGRVADYGVRHFTEPTDGFNTRITFNIIFCVTMISTSMSIIGPLVGTILSGEFAIAQVFLDWPRMWPTNFCAAFWVEILIAQPATRWVMKKKHLRQISQTQGGVADE